MSDHAAPEAFKSLTEALVRESTDEGSFGRGRSYYRQDAVSGTYRRGAVIGGLCQGSQASAYQVEITLAPQAEGGAEPLVAWSCTCPRGGFCKHVVALALTWIAAPKDFAPRQGLAELLAEQSREQLIALIERLIARAPELYAMVERATVLPAPPPARGPGEARTLDPTRVRAQAAAIFQNVANDRFDWDDWDTLATIGADLDELRAKGDAYATAGRWSDALIVYREVAAEILQHTDFVQTDENGDVIGVIVACAAGLTQCLDAQSTLPSDGRFSATERADLIRSLYDIWYFDCELGGVGLAPDAPDAITRNTTPDERARVEGWLREGIGPGGSFGQDWTNRELVTFLVQLREQDGAGDEELLAEYRTAALYPELAEMLLTRGRTDEALVVARQHLRGHLAVTKFASSLLTRGGDAVAPALTFVEDRLFESKDADNAVKNSHYLQWLETAYAAHELPEKALATARRRFRATPNAQTYDAVKTAAQLPGIPAEQWPKLRRELLLALQKQGAWPSLVDIFLAEGEVGEALTALGKLEGRKPQATFTAFGGYYYGDRASYQVRVAEAAQQDYPGRACAIYWRVAEELIERRSRGNYQLAAGYLARVKRLYLAQGREAAWLEEIAALRARNKQLRALKDELNAQELE